MGRPFHSSSKLAASITWASSRQAYWTIRGLVDRDRVADAFRAYGYFRWVDDQLDQVLTDRNQRLDFLSRQQALVEACYAGTHLPITCAHEQMVIDLIRHNPAPSGGLAAYIEHMFRVMRVDAERRGRLIHAAELEGYAHDLALAVTEALLWFIGHDQPRVDSPDQYASAAAAHIAHMLRDAHEDVHMGYFNIPLEVLDLARIGPEDFRHPAYRAWVAWQVSQARMNFAAGRGYLRQLASLRCRLAGFAYQERFVWLLEAVERSGYVLPPAYPLPGLASRTWQGLAPILRGAPRARQHILET